MSIISYFHLNKPNLRGVFILALCISTPVYPKNTHTDEELIIINEALPFAMLSAAIYDCKPECQDQNINGTLWRAIPNLEERSTGSGFHSAVFRNEITQQVAIVFEGTKSPFDWIANVSVGVENIQQEQSLSLAKRLLNWCENTVACGKNDIIVTGHSLGGGHAQYVALTYGWRSYVFNPAGLWDGAVNNIDTNMVSKNRITMFKGKGIMGGVDLWVKDPVSRLGVQFAKKTIEIPINLSSRDIAAPGLAVHSMDNMRDAMINIAQQNSASFKSNIGQTKSNTATLQVEYVDKKSDYVGPHSLATPNGKADGHFHLYVDTGGTERLLHYILLRSTTELGINDGQVAWDTNPNSIWILGVYRDGQRINPEDHPIADLISDSAAYDLFAEDAGWFNEGKTLGLTVAFKDGSWIARSVTIQNDTCTSVPAPSGSKETNQPPAILLDFVGIGQDTVSNRGKIQPDGKYDGIFKLQLNLNSNKEVTNIIIHLVDNEGTPIRGQVWDTEPGGYWMIAVQKNNLFLNPNDESIKDSVKGKTQYTLYANDSGWFKEGQIFRVSVEFSDKSQVQAFTEVGKTRM